MQLEVRRERDPDDRWVAETRRFDGNLAIWRRVLLLREQL
jgi:hypothetical protein